MPYILKERREELLNGEATETPGDLNFMFSIIAADYVATKGESYQTYNDIIGALEACKLELYRRRIGEYEDLKIETNGDLE